MAKESDLLLAKLKSMTKIKETTCEKLIALEGTVTYGKTTDGLEVADFVCAENIQLEAFRGKCYVQRMRDGNMYITQLPKQKRNKALFREDNSSLSKGRDGRYYFYFALDEDQLTQLPVKLVSQARAIAQKVVNELNKLYEQD